MDPKMFLPMQQETSFIEMLQQQQQQLMIQSTLNVEETIVGSAQPSRIQFPWKLHEMLEYAAINNNDDIVSWLPDGLSFKVKNEEAFMEDIMPQYFNQSKFKSFQRQLYIYGFSKVSKGPSRGAYRHPLFTRHNKSACGQMVPQKVKNCKKASEARKSAITNSSIHNKVDNLSDMMINNMISPNSMVNGLCCSNSLLSPANSNSIMEDYSDHNCLTTSAQSQVLSNECTTFDPLLGILGSYRPDPKMDQVQIGSEMMNQQGASNSFQSIGDMPFQAFQPRTHGYTSQSAGHGNENNDLMSLPISWLTSSMVDQSLKINSVNEECIQNSYYVNKNEILDRNLTISMEPLPIRGLSQNTSNNESTQEEDEFCNLIDSVFPKDSLSGL